MSRYVIRCTTGAPASQAETRPAETRLDVAEVVKRAGGRVIDEAEAMLLIEADSATARRLMHLLPGWQLCPETITPLSTGFWPVPCSPARNHRR